MNKPLLWTLRLFALALVSSSANLQMAQQVQAGQTALQTGRPSDAVVYLTLAAERDPDISFRIGYRSAYLAILAGGNTRRVNTWKPESLLRKPLSGTRKIISLGSI